MASKHKKQQDGPRILFFDLETSHNIIARFDLWKSFTTHDDILQERYVICAAWKWLGERTVHSAQISPRHYAEGPADDTPVLRALAEAFEQADLVVAHNGDKYDLKWLNTRMLKNRLVPINPVQSIDTLKIAKQNFDFNSNRLDYIGKLLGVGGKVKHSKGLWIRVLKGEVKAVNEMVKYCKGDIRLLEKVYKKLRPWAAQHSVLNKGKGTNACPRCFSTRTKSKGVHKTATREYQRRICLRCGRPFPSRVVVTKAVLCK